MELENDIEILPHRVAGHSFVSGAKAGVAREKSTGYILKVVDGDERGVCELEFYQKLYNSHDPRHIKLRELCPPFYGTCVIRSRKFMRLGNVSFDGSNVMDVKIGAVTWDHQASEEKILQEKSKYIWQAELGFKVLGFRVTRSNGQVEVLQKEDAKKLSPENLRSTIQFFLSPDDDHLAIERRRDLFIRQLEKIRDVIKNETSFRFISSSILFTYKNVPFNGDVDDEAKATMIDFAHTFQNCSTEPDHNYLKGLASLISFFSPMST